MRIKLRLDFNLRQSLAALLLLGMGPWAGRLEPETLTSTTVFPPPSALYKNFIATNQATLARDGGDVEIGKAANNSSATQLLVRGSLGAGTSSPAFPLDVNGAAVVRGNLTVNGNLVIPTGAQATYVLTAQNTSGTAVWAAPPSGGYTRVGSCTAGSLGFCNSCSCGGGTKYMTVKGSFQASWFSISNQGQLSVVGFGCGPTFDCYK